MSARGRQWLGTAAIVAMVLALTTAWAGWLNARSSPHYQQAGPGAFADPVPEGSMPIRLASLTATPVLLTDRDQVPSAAGTVWVVALLEYQPPPDGSFCMVDLVAVDGRRWSTVSVLEYTGERGHEADCLAKPGEREPVAELLYQVPEDVVDELAGLASSSTGYRGLNPYWVLTPPG
ncbi:hypothetical protein [Micropruina sonneratiae]|uniref:hypothetical protein n=1 Tax=Micropruina sonneratiae TaxID=2986940 RepID=UPI002227E36F|nr:hypothetical protein [Micropruina sp. KQZ13P-5]MCW3159447.1 hypothetical protein [Micropruina sp. KQZ13P-5]